VSGLSSQLTATGNETGGLAMSGSFAKVVLGLDIIWGKDYNLR